MRIVILYRPNAEFARQVEEFAHEIRTRHNVKCELVNMDTRDGIATASIYDIVEFPAIMALREDSQISQLWTGSKLPLISEVASYVVN
jgi:hypothetical protein